MAFILLAILYPDVPREFTFASPAEISFPLLRPESGNDQPNRDSNRHCCKAMRRNNPRALRTLQQQRAISNDAAPATAVRAACRMVAGLSPGVIRAHKSAIDFLILLAGL
jgi:hypothetical protein